MKSAKKRTISSLEDHESSQIPEEILLQKLKKKRPISSEEENSAEEEGECEPSEEEEEEEEEDDDKEERPKLHASHGYHLVKGKMGHGMEDYIVAENRRTDCHELGLYAIFDGHSGRDVAEHLQSHLFDNTLSQPDFWSNPKKAMKRAYKTMDDEILENVVGSRGGSTAVTAILIDNEKLVVANVGDSRAILCRKDDEKQITVDHESQKEKDLVESRGGQVIERPGNIARVDGQLAMTRAFGDGKLKEHITSEPDVRIETINKDIESIILASDGLWKVMSNEEAMECIKDIDDPQEASEELIREALARRSPDDISCVVVMFH